MKLERDPRKGPKPVCSLATSYDVRFSPDGRRIAVVGSGVAIVDAKSGRVERVLRALPHEGSPAYSPDGRLLAVKNPHGDLALVATKTWKLVAKRKRAARAEGPAPAFLDEAHVIDATWAGHVAVRPVGDLEAPTFEVALGGMVRAIAAGDGRIAALVRAGQEAQIVTWRVRGGSVRPHATWACPPADKAFFSEDLTRVFLRMEARPTVEVRRMRATLPLQASRTVEGARGSTELGWHFHRGAFSPDNDVVAVGDGRLGLHVLDGRTLKTRALLPVAGACAAHFSGDGTQLAVGALKRGAVFRVADLPIVARRGARARPQRQR